MALPQFGRDLTGTTVPLSRLGEGGRTASVRRSILSILYILSEYVSSDN